MCNRTPNPTAEDQAPPGAAGALSALRLQGSQGPSERLFPAPANPWGQPDALSSPRPPLSLPGSGHGDSALRSPRCLDSRGPRAGPRGPECPLASRSACVPGPAGGLGPAVWTPVPHPPLGLWVPSHRLGFSMPHSSERWAGCPPTAQVSGTPHLCLQRGAPPDMPGACAPLVSVGPVPHHPEHGGPHPVSGGAGVPHPTPHATLPG